MSERKTIGWWYLLGGVLPFLIWIPALTLVLMGSFEQRLARMGVAIIPIVMVLIALRTKWEPTESVGRQRWAFALLAMGVMLGGVFAWLASPAYLSWAGLLMLMAWMLSMASALPWPGVVARAGLIGIGLPWPFGLLPALASFMQRGSASLLSLIADGLQFFHVRTGNTLEGAQLQFVVEGRLHGIDGLLTLLFAAAILSIVRHRSFFQFGLLCLSAIAILVLGYVLFGLALVLANQWFSYDLMASGTGRYVLGGSILILQLLLLLLNDIALDRLLEPVSSDAVSSDNAFIPLLLNGILTWPQHFEFESEEEVVAKPEVAVEEPNTDDEDVIEPADWTLVGKRRLWMGGIGIAEVGLLGLSLALLVGTFALRNEKSDLIVSKSIMENAPGEGSLPAGIDRFRLTGFSNEDLIEDENVKQLQRSWRYEGLATIVTVKLIYPEDASDVWTWDGQEKGWSNLQTTWSPSARSSDHKDEDAWMWKMETGDSDTQGAVYAWLCGLREDGTPARYRMASTIGERIQERLGRNVLSLFSRQNANEPTVGIQCVVEASEKLTPQELDILKQFFYATRKMIRSKFGGSDAQTKASEVSSQDSIKP